MTSKHKQNRSMFISWTQINCARSVCACTHTNIYRPRSRVQMKNLKTKYSVSEMCDFKWNNVRQHTILTDSRGNNRKVSFFSRVFRRTKFACKHLQCGLNAFAAWIVIGSFKTHDIPRISKVAKNIWESGIMSCARNNYQFFNSPLAIRQEIQRFESVHPSIYAIYDLIDLIPDQQIAQQVRDHVVCIEGKLDVTCDAYSN